MNAPRKRSKGFPFDPFTPEWLTDLSAELGKGQVVSVQPMPSGAAAGLVWSLSQVLPGPLVCVTDRPQSLDTLVRDLGALTGREVDDIPSPSREIETRQADHPNRLHPGTYAARQRPENSTGAHDKSPNQD